MVLPLRWPMRLEQTVLVRIRRQHRARVKRTRLRQWHKELVLEIAIRDPGKKDTHEVTVEWGDGTSSEASVSEGGSSASAGHTYSEPGDHEIKVNVSDDDGGSGSRKSVASVVSAQVEESVATKVEEPLEADVEGVTD